MHEACCKLAPMITQQAREHFSQHGYCLVKGMLDPRDFDAVIADSEKVLDDLCRRMHARGELQGDYADLRFAERYLQISGETGAIFAQHFTIALPQQELSADTPIFLAPSVFDLLVHPRILDAVECFIGPEIAVSPVGNVRIKPPERIIPNADESSARRGLFRATPWHQDNGVITEDADDTPMITVWFSIADAPVESGCLQVIPGSHREDLLCHCPDKNGELSIPDRLLPQQQPVPLPVRAGDVLFLHRRLCHAALPNVGDTLRWSYDLRYIPAGARSGRELFPTFVARSRANPELALTSPRRWAQMWLDARANLVGNAPPPHSWNRWHTDAVACA